MVRTFLKVDMELVSQSGKFPLFMKLSRLKDKLHIYIIAQESLREVGVHTRGVEEHRM